MSNYQTNDVQQLAEVFKALSNPHRLSIFTRLADCCTPAAVCGSEEQMRACVGELGKDLGIVASTVSHHIKELRRAGLIRLERKGQKIECWVDPSTLETLREFFIQPKGDRPNPCTFGNGKEIADE